MAQPEQRGSGVTAPAASDAERRAVVPRKGRPTWSDIQGWRKEGLGRMIGAADFYSLRYSTGNPDWRDDRVLLIFPETNDLCIVGPRQSTSLRPRERDSENEGYRSDFAAIFSAVAKPYRHPSWYPAFDKSTYASFVENAQAFSVVVHKSMFLEEEREAEIQRALANERALNERARVHTLGSADVVRSTLTRVDATFLTGLSEVFDAELDRREHDEHLKAATGAQVDPEVIVALNEDLRRLEKGEET